MWANYFTLPCTQVSLGLLGWPYTLVQEDLELGALLSQLPQYLDCRLIPSCLAWIVSLCSCLSLLFFLWDFVRVLPAFMTAPYLCGACGGQKRVLGLLWLGLLTVAMRTLEIEPRFSGRTAGPPNCWAFSSISLSLPSYSSLFSCDRVSLTFETNL